MAFQVKKPHIMKIVNSISGGKTSAYLAANYKADYNVFSLVRTDDKKCLFPDPKVRQMVSDRLGVEFIGTLEMDTIIYTILDLEQFLGQPIQWVTGITFDEVVKTKGGWLPNKLHRYCTTWLKIQPIFEWWRSEINEPMITQIGYRANEIGRVKTMLDKTNESGLLEFKAIVGRSKNGKRNKWAQIPWQKPEFPLVYNQVFKDRIHEFWKGKPVRFAEHNNCVGCFHRNEVFLNKLFHSEHKNKMNWFSNQEKGRNGKGTWKDGISYEKIKKSRLQLELDLSDFSECDSGYCGI